MKTRLLLNYLAFLATLLSFATSARAQMSDTEKKAAARAAYQEGVQLQDEGKVAEALVRFESAQKLFDAPTHLLHIAECQALTGRLVESSETYETLARKTLAPGAPDAFVQAQQQGQAELPALRARMPTLRVTTKPDPQQLQNLSINVNGVTMPVELLGIARPLNPGTYRFSAQASGWATAAPIDVPLGEKEQKSVELTLVQGAAGATPVVVPPPSAGAPPPYVGPEQRKPKPTGASSTGLLFGVRGGASVPGGQISKTNPAGNTGPYFQGSMDNNASAGGAFGIDAYARLVKILLLGATFEYAGLGAPDATDTTPKTATVTSSAHSTYLGVNIGILPSADHASFIGDVGLGSRTLAGSTKGGGALAQDREGSATGLEFSIGGGLSCPVGPIRLVPRANLGVGSFSSQKTKGATDNSSDIASGNRATHTFFFIGLAAYYSLDLSKKTD
jgi:hypothetical protein